MRLRRTSACLALALAATTAGAAHAVSHEPVLPTTVGADTIYGDLGPATHDAKATAVRTLQKVAAKLHIDASRFVSETVRTTIFGTEVRGRSYLQGVPIDGSASLVTISDGRVVEVSAQDVTLPGVVAPHVISEVRAVAAAVAAVGEPIGLTPSMRIAPKVERLMVADHGRLRDTLRVWTLALHGAAQVDVDAATGVVRTVRDVTKKADGTATVYDPNPVVTLRDNTLRDPSLVDFLPEQSNAKLDSARKVLPLRDVNTSTEILGQLSGPWVQAIGVLPQLGTTLTYKRSDPRFDVAMEYTHIDRYQRYLQDVLGFKGQSSVNAEPQTVLNINDPEDNSFYMPGQDFINYGVGGVDDAEDAEVILHEYGHAVQDAQVPGWGATHEGGSMGEAFGDFQAAAYYAMTSGGFQDACVADWDSTTYSSDKPPCLRRMDSTKIYPRDMQKGPDPDVHADGEMYSAFMWHLRSMLGRTAKEQSNNSLKLIIASHFLQTPNTDFAHGEVAIKMAARLLGHKEWVPLVDRAAAFNHIPTHL